MLIQLPAMSNTERQRQFRERNPGYYGRLHRKRQAEVVAVMQQSAAPQLLLLPAPVEQDLLLQQMAAARQERQPVMLQQLNVHADAMGSLAED